MRHGAVNLDFLRIPVIRQTLRQDTLIRRPPACLPARSLARYYEAQTGDTVLHKLRRRLNISIPGPRQREVRIKCTSTALFPTYLRAETKNYPKVLRKRKPLSTAARENEKAVRRRARDVSDATPVAQSGNDSS